MPVRMDHGGGLYRYFTVNVELEFRVTGTGTEAQAIEAALASLGDALATPASAQIVAATVRKA